MTNIEAIEITQEILCKLVAQERSRLEAEQRYQRERVDALKARIVHILSKGTASQDVESLRQRIRRAKRDIDQACGELEREGRIVSGSNGRVIADGPFVESKETIGGYFLLKVNTLDQAVAIAKECPGLPYV